MTIRASLRCLWGKGRFEYQIWINFWKNSKRPLSLLGKFHHFHPISTCYNKLLNDHSTVLLPSGPFFCLLWSILFRCMIMPQIMNCATTVPRLVMKNWLTSIQISHCGESGQYITLIAQDKMSNLKKTLVKKTSHLLQRSHQACTLWHVGAVTNLFLDFHSCLVEKVQRCFLISSWQDLRKITIPKLSTMQAARSYQSILIMYFR